MTAASFGRLLDPASLLVTTFGWGLAPWCWPAPVA